MRFGRLCIFSTPNLTKVVTNTEAERDSMFWDHRIAMDRFHMVPPSMPRRTPRMPGLARPRTATTSCASGRFWRSRQPSCCTAYPSNGSWKARAQIPSVARKWEVGWSWRLQAIFSPSKKHRLVIKKTPCVSWGKGGIIIQKWVSRH